MTIAYQSAIAAVYTSGGTSLSCSGVTLSGTNRALGAFVGAIATTTKTPSSVTFAGSGLTQEGSTVTVGTYYGISAWRLVAPSTSASSVLTANFAATSAIYLGGINCTDVDQSSPVRGTASGTNAAGLSTSYNATTVSGDLVLSGAIGYEHYTNPNYDTSFASLDMDPGASQTERFNHIDYPFASDSGSGTVFAGGTKAATSTSTSSGWSAAYSNDGSDVSENANYIASIAMVFKDSGGGGGGSPVTESLTAIALGVSPANFVYKFASVRIMTASVIALTARAFTSKYNRLYAFTAASLGVSPSNLSRLSALINIFSFGSFSLTPQVLSYSARQNVVYTLTAATAAVIVNSISWTLTSIYSLTAAAMNLTAEILVEKVGRSLSLSAAAVSTSPSPLAYTVGALVTFVLTAVSVSLSAVALVAKFGYRVLLSSAAVSISAFSLVVSDLASALETGNVIVKRIVSNIVNKIMNRI